MSLDVFLCSDVGRFRSVAFGVAVGELSTAIILRHGLSGLGVC